MTIFSKYFTKIFDFLGFLCFEQINVFVFVCFHNTKNQDLQLLTVFKKVF